jgi:hypothetical protein
LARRSPQSQAKRLREQTKQAKRRAKDEKKALRKAEKLGDPDPLPDATAESNALT